MRPAEASSDPSNPLRESADAWPELIAAARGGDDEALGTIVHQVRDYLLAIAESNHRPCLRAKFDASDVVQQSLAEASTSLDTFEGASEAELRVWMKRIVLHNLSDQSRRYTHTQSRDVGRESHAGAGGLACPRNPTASALVSRRETNEQLRHAVERLPERQRRVVENRHRWGRSYRQIADELGITENAARNLWTRAMQNLREMLLEEDGRLKR